MRRIGSLVLVVALVAVVAPLASAAPAKPSHAAALPAADILGLFGGENEPDENEPDENGAPASHRHASKRGKDDTGSALPVPLAVILGAAGVVLAVFTAAALIVRRWVRRYRAFKRELAFQARGWARRVGDDLDRARRRWPR